MSTARQQNASRQNGARSIGPITGDGKARSAQNAVKHGLTGTAVVLPDESQEKYDALKASLAKTYCVETPAEWSLLEEMAACRWRLNRIEILETAILTQAFQSLWSETHDQEGADRDSTMTWAFADVAENSKGFRMLDRHQRTLWRSYDRSLQELQNMQQLRAAEEHETRVVQNE